MPAMDDGFPSVRRFSSLLDFLELCDTAVIIKSSTLDCDLLKTTGGLWEGVDGEGAMTARELVVHLRMCIYADDPQVNLETTHIMIEPVDKVSLKREVADSTAEEPFMTVGMALCEMELDGEEFVETKTFDGGPATTPQPKQQLESYQLPLHLRLPPNPNKKRIIQSSPSPSLSPSPERNTKVSAPINQPSEAVRRCVEAAVQAVVKAAAVPPAPPLPDRDPPRLMPRAGTVVTVPIVDDAGNLTGREQSGFVFRVIRSKKKPEKDIFAVVFPDCSWDSYREAEWADHWRACTSIPEGLPLGAICRKEGGKFEKPEGFLFERQQATAHGWELFSEYRAGGSGPPVQYHASRLVERLQAGQRVTCSGRVLGQQCNDTSEIYFIAIAHGLEDESKQIRCVAIVAIDGDLAIAQLLSDDEGYLLPVDPPSRMPTEQLKALQEQADAFISNRKVAATYKALMRQPAAPSQLQLRPRHQKAQPAAVPAEAEAAGPGENARRQAKSAKQPKASLPVFPHDLKGVSISRLRALSEEQLQQACAQREVPLTADAGAPQMLTALLQFRARQGRTRRAANSSGGGGSSHRGGSDGGGSDGGGSDGGGSDGGDDGDAFIRRGGSDGGSSDGSEEEREKEKQIEAKKRKKREKHERKAREAREEREKREKSERKKRKKRARSPSSSSSSSDSSTKPSPKHQKASPSSNCSTPWDVVKAREERDALEAARMARLNAKIDRHERKKHEKKRRY